VWEDANKPPADESRIVTFVAGGQKTVMTLLEFRRMVGEVEAGKTEINVSGVTL